LLAPGGVDEPGPQGLVDLGPRVAQAGRLQSVAPDPQQPDPLGHGPQQLHRVPLGQGGATGRLAPGRADPGGAGGDPGLGGGQAAAGEQGEPVAVGGELDQGVDSGEQPEVSGWHGGPLQVRRAGRPQPATPPCGSEEG
jgi:hypothetical protein